MSRARFISPLSLSPSSPSSSTLSTSPTVANFHSPPPPLDNHNHIDALNSLHELSQSTLRPRQSRPLLQQRSSSYNKRHSSFDTPREVPFPASPSSSSTHHRASSSLFDVRGYHQRAPVCRTDSDSTIVIAGHRTPGPVPHNVVHPAAQAGYVPTPGTSGTAQDNFYPHNATFDATHSLPSTACVEDDDGSSSLANNHMTYNDKARSEGHEGPLLSRTSPDFTHNENRNAGFWDSSHLRPELLSSPAAKAHPDYASHHTSFPGPNSPYFLENKDGCEIMSPTPTRPSSAASLPLPSQMPFYALPAASAVGPPRGSLGLPAVKEQEMSYFAFGSSASHSEGNTPPSQYSTSNASGSSPGSSSMSSYPPRTSSSSPGSFAALFESADRNSRNPRISATDSASTVSTMLSSSSHTSQISSASSALFPPTPPTVHSPPAPTGPSILEDDPIEAKERESKRQSAPYEPFLSHAPPPADSYITVETCDLEYRLIVRLPGYRRDAIMLSTRRRRILHIAADSWEAGGGHFERRISFGYDADLARVRAEFDGEHLRVLVPRKSMPASWFGGAD